MTFSPITHIRHFDIAVPDFEKQIEFYKNHWGLTVQHDDGDVVYFAAEGSPEQYVTRVRRSADKRLDLVAFGAADRASVDTLAQDLIQAGVKLVFEPTDLQTLGGGYGFRFFDLEGRTVEVSTDVAVRQHRKIERRESIPVRLSHVVLNSNRPEAMRDWYEKHLGFRLSDTLNHPHVGDLFYFMRCSSQHHSMAIARGPHASLQHASFELRGIDEYMFGSGRIIRAGYRKLWGPGRHRAGDNTFTYFTDPNGNTMEMTTELENLEEDTWHPHIYDVQEPETSDQWGTGGDMNEFITKEMFNDSDDRHLFVAPPV
ncbi:VOC family protein [Microbacterium kribbense]|uniref:VOC family protein n=1 Tax=Microbacterium kribbense TaxID=433645 RepID=A0ABP7GZA4_9MICO|nr:VOC family protein [Microbacterium bovistercoris]